MSCVVLCACHVVFRMQAALEEVAEMMKHDVVMLVLLLAYYQNATKALSWEEVLMHPELEPTRGRCPILPQLCEVGLPTGHPWLLSKAQLGFTALLWAAGYPGCTAHGECSSSARHRV